MDAQQVKEWLQLNKKSQKWLADSLKVDIATINRWLCGRGTISPSLQAFISLIVQEGDSIKSPQSMHAPLTQEELSTAAQSIQRTPEGLVQGVLGLLGQSAINNALPTDEMKP